MMFILGTVFAHARCWRQNSRSVVRRPSRRLYVAGAVGLAVGFMEHDERPNVLVRIARDIVGNN